MKYLLDDNGELFEAMIISNIPKGFKDISEGLIIDEEAQGLAPAYLQATLIEEVSAILATPEMWSNGETIVYDINDIPMIMDEDENPIADPTYIRTEAVEGVDAVPAHYRLSKKADADTIKSKAKKRLILKAAMSFGQELILDFGTENMELGITQDGMTKTVRQTMSEIVSALQTGSLKDAMDEIDSITEDQKDDKYITNDRLQEYKQKILDYLGE